MASGGALTAGSAFSLSKDKRQQIKDLLSYIHLKPLTQS
jgi:hypothetical protein